MRAPHKNGSIALMNVATWPVVTESKNFVRTAGSRLLSSAQSHKLSAVLGSVELSVYILGCTQGNQNTGHNFAEGF